MTLQQEAYNVIDQLSDEGIKVFLDMFNKIQFLSVSGFKKSDKATANSSSKDGMVDVVADGVVSSERSDDGKTLGAEVSDSESKVEFIDSLNIDDMRKMSKDEKKALFFKSGGKMKLDTKAIYDMRERSMI